jgi:hypothetical protein
MIAPLDPRCTVHTNAGKNVDFFFQILRLILFKAYIDISDMAKALYNKYPEYERKKFKVFRTNVEAVFNKLCQDAGGGGGSDQKKAAPIEIEDHERAPMVIDTSSSDEADKTTKVNGSSMNNTVTKLYSSSSTITPKTDFDRIKGKD